MDADEQEICRFLEGCRGEFVSQVEISKRASSKRRFQKDPHWAVPALHRLVERRILESDSMRHYRLIPTEKQDKLAKGAAAAGTGGTGEARENSSGTFDVPDDSS